MDIDQKNKIYDRLLAINLKIDIEIIPNPQYINKAIGECHVFIEEVSRYSIEVKKEISIMQQALNNAEAEYEYRLESLISEDEDIKNLPSIRDREAKANLFLREEIQLIKKYKNDVTDLKNLNSAIALKNKNLNRTNLDIKMQLKILEAQIRLGAGPTTDIAVQSLVEEFKKGLTDEDSFEDAESEMVEEKTIDPSAELDIDDILDGEINYEVVPEKLIEPDPEPKPEEQEEKKENLEEFLGVQNESEVPIGLEKSVSPVEEDIQDNSEVELPGGMGVVKIEDTYEVGDTDETEESEKENVIDLDSVIDFNQSQEGGGEKPENQSKKEHLQDEADPDQKESRQGIDIDDLLDSVIITK